MKYLLLLMAMTTMIGACSKKTMSSKSTQPTATTTTTPPPDTKKEPATETKVDANESEMVLAGRKIYTTKCTKCHEAKPVENWNTTAWNNILKSMIPKARLTEEESKQVTTYVMINAKK